MKRILPVAASIVLTVANFPAAAKLTSTDLYGEPASSAIAERTVEIGPKTRWVNVKSGETVKFVFNGQDFTWHFDGLSQSFKLKQISPQDGIPANVAVYVIPTVNSGAP